MENQLQRRTDLIPNLVSVTQAYAQHEKELISLLVQSRQAYLQGGVMKMSDVTTIEIEALIDGRDLLIIDDDTLQWQHLDFAAVGRHEGRNEPTAISTTLDGVTVMDRVEWFPEWSAPPPDEIRREEFSSIFSGLMPALPPSDFSVSLNAIEARNAITIAEFPSEENDFSIIVDFNDNPIGGSTTYIAELTMIPLNPLFDTLTVDTLVDEDDGDLSPGDVSLREAISFVNPGGTIDFDASLASADVGLGSGTIGLELGELVIDKNLTINGLGADELTVSGNNDSRVFKIDDSNESNQIEVVIDGLTITDGSADFGAGIFNRENLTVTSSVIRNNLATADGSALFNVSSGTVEVSNSTLGNNLAEFRGGGISNGSFDFDIDGGTVTINNSTIIDILTRPEVRGFWGQATLAI